MKVLITKALACSRAGSSCSAVTSSCRRSNGTRSVPPARVECCRPAEAPWFYFVHSYVPVPVGPSLEAIAGTAEYGDVFVAAIESAYLWGVQFHPEKSGTAGLSLLARFVAMAEPESSGLLGAANRA